MECDFRREKKLYDIMVVFFPLFEGGWMCKQLQAIHGEEFFVFKMHLLYCVFK